MENTSSDRTVPYYLLHFACEILRFWTETLKTDYL